MTASELAQKAMDKTERTFEQMVPTQYHHHQKVFSEEASQQFPPKRPWDHTINLLPDTPTTQAACSLSISGGHAQVLLQMEGYTLLPEDGRQPRQSTIARAVRFGHVVALKLLHSSGAINELDILKYLQMFNS